MPSSPVFDLPLPLIASALIAAAALLALVALATTAFGLRQRRYDGWHWWTTALWQGAAAVALAAAALHEQGALVPLAVAALLPAPLLALQGLRRFHPRQALAWHARADAGVALLAAALLGLAAALPEPLAHPLAAATVLGLHGYVAAVLLLGPGGRDFVPVQVLALTVGLSGGLPLAAVLVGMPVLAAQAAALALVLPVLAFVGVALVCERTERQLRDSRRRLRVLAHLDSLTQLPNRRHFEALAESALTQDEPGTAALLHIDVDHFKRINDLFGHAAGDRALQLVSQAMLEALRANDIPGRQGGDEFVLLLRRTTPAQAMSVAQRITTEVQRRAPLRQLPTVSLSVGVVQVAFGEGVAAALRRADQALYEAKRQGRSCAVTAEGDEDTPVFGVSRPMGLQVA
ncbi:MAG: GGDEF domain-containing protein [Rubrivivax sp.]|nr:GGDEF domain-containing protein [Rubrivivax sp.]